MAYLNVDLDYFDHPKTIKLIGLLGPGTAEIPIRLWCRTGKFHSKDGCLDGFTDQAIEVFVGWHGKPGQCVDALVKTGFLEKLENTYLVVDWREHNGHLWTLKKRNKKVAQNRWKRLRQNVSDTQSAVDTSGKNVVDHELNSGVPLSSPFLTTPIPSKSRGWTPPTLDEVKSYCRERIGEGKAPVNSEAWYSHYESNGWMVGKNKMKNWKAAICSWEHNSFGPKKPVVQEYQDAKTMLDSYYGKK